MAVLERPRLRGGPFSLASAEPLLGADVHSRAGVRTAPRTSPVQPCERHPLAGLLLGDLGWRFSIACIDADIVRRAQDVMRLLVERQLSVVTAESCTAGLISAALSEGEGASAGLQGAFVTYTKEQKAMTLGVPAGLLASRGSVNGDVVRRMVEGALDRSSADVALAVTGVLGPEPDEDGNPVGLVFFGCCRRGQLAKVVERRFPLMETDRLRHAVVMTAFDLMEETVFARDR
jgi:nicotinamide-nucleotide amidase